MFSLCSLFELFAIGVTAERKSKRTSEYRLKSAIPLQRGQFDPKFQVKGVTRHQPFFFSEN